MKKRVLILCTGNSCRSQMAEGYLRLYANTRAEIFSAGIEAHGINPLAIKVMEEDGVDIHSQTSDLIDNYLNQHFDFIVTVCDNAYERCPIFPDGAIKIHCSFPDPARAQEHERLETFRFVRNEIKACFQRFAEQYLKV